MSFKLIIPMKNLNLLLIVVGSLALANVGCADQGASEDWNEVSQIDRLLMGDYIGEWIDPPKGTYQKINPTLSAQVISIDESRYTLRFMQDLNRRAHPYFEGEGFVAGDRILCYDKGWKIEVTKSGLKGEAKVGEQLIPFKLERVKLGSPTLGLEPPEGAVVLFDGSDFDEWEHDDGRAVTWHLLGSGAMEINPNARNKDAEPKIGGGIRTRRNFKDVRLHIEFRYPVEPGKSGQGRGNSGLFFQGEYEVQVLNSYGLEGLWNECGALYKAWPPKVNAARPPMEWQTYDVVYRAPRFENGKQVENARITVDHNGVRIHNDQEILFKTSHTEEGRYSPAPQEAGPISLQDHSNCIQYRNIWVQEL